MIVHYIKNNQQPKKQRNPVEREEVNGEHQILGPVGAVEEEGKAQTQIDNHHLAWRKVGRKKVTKKRLMVLSLIKLLRKKLIQFYNYQEKQWVKLVVKECKRN
ncbi:hypothetical protein M0812_27938 [Anaeramoeba flamelloides]|uniref:Uncharacterized protein n=1 Tax=Anaeramoeba flamelloides TaxID=1746091 RepID=A0AAV7YA46_9EUKA|nr:hypothetical protein M0812_27938 [Anaeramoeba flamelloides]